MEAPYDIFDSDITTASIMRVAMSTIELASKEHCRQLNASSISHTRGRKIMNLSMKILMLRNT